MFILAASVHFVGVTFYAIFASGELQPWAEPSPEQLKAWEDAASGGKQQIVTPAAQPPPRPPGPVTKQTNQSSIRYPNESKHTMPRIISGSENARNPINSVCASNVRLDGTIESVKSFQCGQRLQPINGVQSVGR